jgi:hypothetical protein
LPSRTYPRYSVRASVRCSCGSPRRLSFWRVSPPPPAAHMGGLDLLPSHRFDLLGDQDPPSSWQNYLLGRLDPPPSSPPYDLLGGQHPFPSRRDETCCPLPPGGNLRNSLVCPELYARQLAHIRNIIFITVQVHGVTG